MLKFQTPGTKSLLFGYLINREMFTKYIHPVKHLDVNVSLLKILCTLQYASYLMYEWVNGSCTLDWIPRIKISVTGKIHINY